MGRKYDPQWGWTRYEKSLKELIGAEEAKGYTRLALMGVAKNAGKYDPDDLIRIGRLGLREMTELEINEIKNYLIQMPFSTRSVKVPREFQGVEFHGMVFEKWGSSDLIHWYKRTVSEKQWAEGMSFPVIVEDLRKSILQEDAKIVAYEFHNQRVVGVLSENRLPEDHRGEKSVNFIYTVFSLKNKVIISGYQTLGIEKLYIPDGARWITK